MRNVLGTNYFEVSDISAALDVHPNTVSNHLRMGKVSGARRVAGSWLVRPSDLAAAYGLDAAEAAILQLQISPAASASL